MSKYDCIIVGAGHAGIEAALAASRMNCKTLLVSLNLDTIGLMSCNPAIGGVGKGQLVKEIDALGGQMAKAADACCINLRTLNLSKGAAVRSTRGQEDKFLYKQYMRKVLEAQDNLTLKQAEVTDLLVKNDIVHGIKTDSYGDFYAKTVIITAGTFLSGLIHIGLESFAGGRLSEKSSILLDKQLKKLGFNILRFKTGTCARLSFETINFEGLIKQISDRQTLPFSFSNQKLKARQVPCYITYTNKKTHQIIRENLKYSPLYSGKIKASGVRYCPSIEDKIVKFPDRARHQIFLEPEGLNTDQVYPNGLSTSLPFNVQIKMYRSIEGLEKVKLLKPGYGIEYTVVDPTQSMSTLETKRIKNLYLAGQINGTTGYEEAASLGLIAGINAALKVKKKPPLVIDRCQGYIGVLIDDLTTKGTNEPYRMFTSRVEQRLLLREDNADLRLKKIGKRIGLVSNKEYKKTEDKVKKIHSLLRYLREHKVSPNRSLNLKLKKLKTTGLRQLVTLESLLRRPQVSFSDLDRLVSFKFKKDKIITQQVEIEVKYKGFIERENSEVLRFRNLEKIKMPLDFNYNKVYGLSNEIKEKLSKFRPLSLGQASRISGVTPAAISILMIWLKKRP